MRFPKNPRRENKAFRDLARLQDCTMNVPGVCNYMPETVVLAHSNWMEDNKGKGYKAHDHTGVWACYACHSWLDQGRATDEEKRVAFTQAQARMIQRLADIATSPTAKPAHVEAARWALLEIKSDLNP